MLRLYNTLSQTKEPFQTVKPGEVGMYVCGPTVYSQSHIGHMVGPVIFDTIKRYLVYLGYRVRWVVNITDIDDKLIVRVRDSGATEADMAAKVKELAERMTDDYLVCLKALGVDGIDDMPRATEHIGDIIEITQGLIDKGFAYASAGDVYFDVTKAHSYGKLSHRQTEDLQAGARVETTGIKRNPGDFALWKGSKPGEPSWSSPWGEGRPGWHIECSAMSMKILGSHFDIHGGGLDLIFPHHENEIVQSESYSGKPFATYWLHNGLLTKDGKKISKSDPETIVLMADLLLKYDADTLRCLFLASHYRRPTDYGPDRLPEIARGLQAFRNLFDRFERITKESFFTLEVPAVFAPAESAGGDEFLTAVVDHRQRFLEAMDDDFNTGGALGELYELARVLNRFADVAKLETTASNDPKRAAYRVGLVVLRELTAILGLFRAPIVKSESSGSDRLTSPLLDLLVTLRASLRQEKNFKLGDVIRQRLTELGVTLEDRPDGTSWRVD